LAKISEWDQSFALWFTFKIQKNTPQPRDNRYISKGWGYPSLPACDSQACGERFYRVACDPIGEGERLQYPDPTIGKSTKGSSTQEHACAGVQTSLTGSSLSDYFIWDGIRAVDLSLLIQGGG
jgi:hypothetical protein